MSRIRDWGLTATVLVLGRGRRRRRRERDEPIVEPTPKRPGSELAVVCLLLLAALSAAGFPVVYALDRLPRQTQLLGLSLGLAFAFLAAALILLGEKLVPDEQREEEYPEPDPHEQEAVAEIVEQSASGLSRKRLLGFAAGAAGTALGAALITPAVSLGPVFDTRPFYDTPWRRGRRLVDDKGRPFRADAIEENVFYTAYPEGADRERLGSPLVVVRLSPAVLRLPEGRADWAPGGILAFSKICTHAGCAVSLYRTPLFPLTEPGPALVCPCHYSTFDPATGASVTFGPAGRPLPQLPLQVDVRGELRAGGNFSGPVGPSWWGVRMGDAT